MASTMTATASQTRATGCAPRTNAAWRGCARRRVPRGLRARRASCARGRACAWRPRVTVASATRASAVSAARASRPAMAWCARRVRSAAQGGASTRVPMSVAPRTRCATAVPARPSASVSMRVVARAAWRGARAAPTDGVSTRRVRQCDAPRGRCVDGRCVDGCQGVRCPAGSACVAGSCVAVMDAGHGRDVGDVASEADDVASDADDVASEADGGADGPDVIDGAIARRPSPYPGWRGCSCDVAARGAPEGWRVIVLALVVCVRRGAARMRASSRSRSGRVATTRLFAEEEESFSSRAAVTTERGRSVDRSRW